MTLLERQPTATDRLRFDPTPLPSLCPSEFLSLVRAWEDVALFEEVTGRTATIEEVEQQLEASGLSHLPPLGPGARVEYSYLDGSVVRGHLACGPDWVEISTATQELLGYGTWELEDAWLHVEVPLTHTMFEQDRAPTQRIRVNAREIGLLSEQSGDQSRLLLVPSMEHL